MANILVTGAHGTLGHVVCRVLSQKHRVIGTCRGPRSSYAALDCLQTPDFSLIDRVDLTDPKALAERLPQSDVSMVINCAGLIKQRPAANDPMATMQVNALMPLRLAQWCEARGARLVHISTDCVFSGKRGGYSEADTPDPVDLYGLSKLLGEVGTAPHLTLRTSFIGPQLSGQEGLLAWFLAQRGTIKGFAKAIFSGLTTTAFAQVIEKVVDGPLPLSGLYHVAARPISKYALLCEIEHRLRLGVAIERDDVMECDRSLDGHRFANASGIVVPGWDDMLDTLCAELDAGSAHRPARAAARWATGASP
jgi:dTDP-4-dehydrorhamnose reductase